MNISNQGLNRFPFRDDRWRTSPYREIAVHHGQEGRLAIQVYEAALSFIATKHCVGMYDDVFLMCLSEYLQLSQQVIKDAIDLALTYRLFNMELKESLNCLTSQEFQAEYFNVRKHFRYSDTVIDTKHVLLSFDERRMLYIGFVVEEVKVGNDVQLCWNEQRCRLYGKKKYQELFPGEAEISMQKKLQEKAFGLFKR